nr:phage GP46 family protein [Xanthomonas albilineans]
MAAGARQAHPKHGATRTGLRALQWLIDDGVAARIAVRAERQSLSTLALQCTLFAADGTANAVLRFDNLWSLLNV